MKLSQTNRRKEAGNKIENNKTKMNSKDSNDAPQTSYPTRAMRQESGNGNGVESHSASDASTEEEESDYEDSYSPEQKKKKGGRRRKNSPGEDNEYGRPKKKRKTLKMGSDSEDNDEGDESSPNKGRHEIRRIIKEKHLTVETKEAAAEEKARRQRMEERQILYNKYFSLPIGEGENVSGRLVLDFNPKTMGVLVEVNQRLVKKLKPHQVKGVKFMWDACFESIDQIKSGAQGGAILAHCMGLGKTLQTITLTHTLLDNKSVDITRVMVICPVNTVKNWQDEYSKWLTGSLELDVYEMSQEKDNWGRADKLSQWFRDGGVLIIGYEMFRNLVNEKNNKFKKKQKETYNSCLLDPGPDVVICDEGHLLKNEKSAINKAVNRIKTNRRIVLTGTPLQNNLKEYFEMVNFVKPHLLGTRKEFMNRFVNPIVNGQHSDSTERDVRTMKKRSFILSDLLKGCMQRLDYSVLVPYLQPKLEYVISITMTDLQKKLYKYYLENYAQAGQIGPDGKLEGGKKGGLFYDVQNLSRIWNHPCILLLAKQRKENKEGLEDEDKSLKEFICDEDEDDSGNDDDSDIQEVDSDGMAMIKRVPIRTDKPYDFGDGLENTPGAHKGWWNSFLEEGEQLDAIEFGNKMVLLMDILKESALIGDKVLVFSQSLLSLDLIEDFLARVNTEDDQDISGAAMADFLDTWIPGKDYYRMDGSTSAETRKIWCKTFNKTTSHRMRLFLISTKAGGLGINLVAANRVIIFDASWNPSHDVQSIFRVFRFGQTKPVYIYRFLAKGTMEEKIYDRQVTKQSLSARVVDEQQIERHFTMNELAELYEFKDEPLSARPVPAVPEDRMLAELVDRHKDKVWTVSNHDSLLENQVDQNLTEEERKAAWEEYEQEKRGMIQTNVGIENTEQFGMMLQTMLPKSGDGRIMASPINPMAIQAQLRQMNPELTHEDLLSRTRAAIMQLQNMHRTQTPVIVNKNTLNVGQRNTTGYDQSYYQAEMAKAKAMINQQYPGMYRFGFRGPNPHGPGPNPMAGVSSMSNIRRPPPAPEVLGLDSGPPPMARMPIRAPTPAGRGGRGRGGRRGRPRLDPDTDLDFSPEPSSNMHNEMLLARLQQAGMTVTQTTGSKSES